MNKELVLGAEAIALAAIDEGISGVYAYPGTPSTEIAEFIQRSSEAGQRKIYSRWSVNEKTAYEEALGMSYAGKRSIVCMKHVGLNVAADPFINSALSGVHGGLVVVVADDPSMHSSQNEQDTRFYGKFTYLPLLEPSSQQEAYDSMRHAMRLSEEVKLPVIMRITTRLSHSRSAVVRTEAVPENPLQPDREKNKWILLPVNARKRYIHLLDIQNKLLELSENSPFSREEKGEGRLGVIAFGIAYNYVMEVNTRHQLNIPFLKISQYPLPEKKIKEFCDRHDRILVAEEGFPICEEMLRGFFVNPKISGRLDGSLPRTGELSPDILARALLPVVEDPIALPSMVANRPPELCQGCGHRDLFEALNLALENYPDRHVFSDIGCYTLGAMPPFNAIDTCVDMGASVTMAKGAADAGLQPVVTVIGDSTFTHSGITGLLDAVNEGNQITVIISDNLTTAMTGGQDSAGTNKLYEICRGVGVEEGHIRSIVPLKKNQEMNVQILKEEIDYKGVSVILSCRECIQTARRKKSK